MPNKIRRNLSSFDEKTKDADSKKSGVTFEQKQRFLENVKLFEDYEAGTKILELSKKYELSETLVEKIVTSIEIAEKQLN